MHYRVRTAWQTPSSKMGCMPCTIPGLGLERPAVPGVTLHSERFFPARSYIEGPEGFRGIESVQEVADVVEVAEVVVGDMEAVARVTEYGDLASSEEVPVLPFEILEDPILDDMASFEINREEPQESKRTTALILLNVMTFLMASNGVVIKNIGDLVDPFTFSALRFTVSSLAFAPFLLKLRPGGLEKTDIQAGLEIGFWSTLGYLFQTLGLEFTDASKAGFLGGMFVVFVPILAGLSGKGVSKITWAGTALSVLGASLLEGGSSTAFGLGDVYCLLSATFFSIQMLRTEMFTKSLPSSSTLPILGVATLTTSIISAALAATTHSAESVSFLYNLFTHTLDIQGLTSLIHGFPWIEILYTGVFSTALVLFIEMAALEHVTSTDAAIVYAIEPVLAGALACVFLGERLMPVAWVGAAVIVAASIGTQLLSPTSESDPGKNVQMTEID